MPIVHYHHHSKKKIRNKKQEFWTYLLILCNIVRVQQHY